MVSDVFVVVTPNNSKWIYTQTFNEAHKVRHTLMWYVLSTLLDVCGGKNNFISNVTVLDEV